MADDFDLDSILDDALDDLDRAEEAEPQPLEAPAAGADTAREELKEPAPHPPQGEVPGLEPQNSEPSNCDPGAQEFRQQMAKFMNLLKEDDLPEGKENDPDSVPKLEELLKSVLHPPGAEEGEDGADGSIKDFDALLKSVLGNPGQAGPNPTADPEAPKPPKATGDIIGDALNMMSHGREKLKEDASLAGGEDEMLMNLLKGLTNFDPSNPESLENALSGIMDEMFTKDVLEEPVNRVATAFPTWLEENKSKVSTEELDRYTKQSETFKEVALLLEKEDPDMKVVREKIDGMMDDGELPAELRTKMFGDLDPSKLLGADGLGLSGNEAEEMKKLMGGMDPKKAMEGCPVQ